MFMFVDTVSGFRLFWSARHKTTDTRPAHIETDPRLFLGCYLTTNQTHILDNRLAQPRFWKSIYDDVETFYLHSQPF